MRQPAIAVLVGGLLFSGGINNTGKISAGASSTGIDITAASFTGGITNSGLIAGGAAGIAINTAHPVSIFDTGTIVGGLAAIQFAGSGNTLTLGAGYGIIGTVDPSGNNSLQLGGTGSGSFDLSSIGTQYLGFTSLNVVGGDWKVSGSGNGWTVKNGGTLRLASGATLGNTTVSSGTLEVSSGSVLNGSTVKSGGTEIVDSGGTAFATVSNGGLEVAIAGGSGSAGVFSGGTLEFVGGGANQAFSATLQCRRHA